MFYPLCCIYLTLRTVILKQTQRNTNANYIRVHEYSAVLYRGSFGYFSVVTDSLRIQTTLNPDPHPDPGLAVSKGGSGSKVLLWIQAWFCQIKNLANIQLKKFAPKNTFLQFLFFFSL